MTECSVLRINTSTPTVWLHWPTCRPSSDVCTSTLPSASSGEGKKHNYRCLDITGFIVINSRVFFLTRCWFQIKPKPKPYWSIWTKSLPRSNWNLQLNIDLPSLFWFALQPQIAATSVLLQKPQSAEKKKLWGPTYIIYILYLLRGPFSPRTIVYIKDDKNAFQSDWRPSHEDIQSIIHLSLGPRPSSLHVCEKCLSTPQEMMWGMSRSFFFIYWNQQHHWCVSYLAGAYSPFINCCLMKAGCLRTIICNE